MDVDEHADGSDVPLPGQESGEERFDDFVRGAPELVGADAVKGDLAWLGPAWELPILNGASFGVEEILQRDFEDLVDLGFLAAPCGGWNLEATEERRNAEAGRDGFDDRQRGQNLDQGSVQADFFFGFAQCSSHQIGVFGLASAAGEGDLATVHAERAAADEDQAQPTVSISIKRRKDRRINKREGGAQSRHVITEGLVSH
jgi:hypothetical protein